VSQHGVGLICIIQWASDIVNHNALVRGLGESGGGVRVAFHSGTREAYLKATSLGRLEPDELIASTSSSGSFKQTTA